MLDDKEILAAAVEGVGHEGLEVKDRTPFACAHSWLTDNDDDISPILGCLAARL